MKNARCVYRRSSDNLFSVLSNLAARRPGNRATNKSSSTKLTRGKFLKAMGAGVAWIALTNTPGSEPAGRVPNVRSFCSRPNLHPPTIDIVTHAHNTAPGDIFLAPKKGAGQDGPMILNNSGRPVWFHPLQKQDGSAMDFKAQRYRGEPVLTWCESEVVAGHGQGECVIADSSYREIRRVRAGNGYEGDHHEFLITPQETALITIYGSIRMDLSPVGGSKDGRVLPPAVESYRAFRFPWSGQPGDDPAVAVEVGSGDALRLYASWNGATEVASWPVVAGSSPDKLKPVGSATPREGFETAITVRGAGQYVAVQAKDSSGRVLGTSRAARPRS
jgi:hypothetical protein